MNGDNGGSRSGGGGGGGGGAQDTGSNHIRTFLRIKPTKNPSGFIKVDEFDKAKLAFRVPIEHRDAEVCSIAS